MYIVCTSTCLHIKVPKKKNTLALSYSNYCVVKIVWFIKHKLFNYKHKNVNFKMY